METRNAHDLPRVVVTGVGAVSCAGAGVPVFLDALRMRKHGLRRMDAFAALGMRASVGGPVDETALPPEPPRKLRRFLAAPALYAWHAANEALAHAGLSPSRLAAADCGLVLGGGAALSVHEEALAAYRDKGFDKLSPFIVPRGMSGALSASLAHAFAIGGVSCTISAACSSAAHALGQAMELIQLGRQNIVLAGGAEELHPSTSMWFDAMGALSPQADPARASRPFHRQRDGLVLAAGAGALVLESLEHARSRGAPVLAELAGYGSATDAASMVGSGASGVASALRQALDRSACLPDYINANAAGTPADLAEWQAIAAVFGERHASVPPISSIKGLIGHAPQAAGALDAIACVLMLQHGFLAAGTAVDDPDPAFADAPLLTANREQRVDAVLSNSFGFGGSCAALMFRRLVEPAT